MNKGNCLWELTSQGFNLERPINIAHDTDYPGIRFSDHRVNGLSLRLYEYNDVELLWYNYGVYVLDSSGKPIEHLCYLFGDAPSVESLKSDNPRVIDGTTASISHWVPANYCHIICEHLPLVQALYEANQLETVDHILCDNWAINLLHDVLQLYPVKINTIGIKVHDHVKCKKLLAFEPIRHPANWGHETMLRFFDRIRDHVNVENTNRRLLVTRPLGRRGFENQDALAAALPDFDIVNLDTPMNLYEQARLFAEAEIVVCGHGAALTNLAFMKENSGIVEIFNHDYGMASYWILSGAKKIRYCASIDIRGPLPNNESGKSENMIVNIDQVIENVQKLKRER